jgi:hypothetical protein
LISGSQKNNDAQYHYPHEYSDTLKNIYLTDFLQSDEHEQLQRKHNRAKDVSFTTFKTGAMSCPCITEPKYRFCVDEVETGFVELLKALQARRKLAKKNNVCTCNFCTREVQNKRESPLDYIHPVSSAAVMLGHLQCDKVPFPAMDESMPDCKCFQKQCSFNDCNACTDFLSDANCVLQCPMLFSQDATYHWKAFANHQLDNENSIRELRQFHGNGQEFKEVFLTQLVKFKKHYFVYRWLQFQRKFDINNLTRFDIYIQTGNDI